MKKRLNLIGEVFDRLTVIARYAKNEHGKTIWECQCSCGNKCTVIHGHLTSGHTRSCGCLSRDVHALMFYKHGLADHPLYRTLIDMIKRCYDSSNKNYRWYGAKGVEICDEWMGSVEAFVEWGMSNGFKEGLTIDRIDSGGNYEPDNCCFMTRSENTTKMIKENYR